jgi:hypothetical protein
MRLPHIEVSRDDAGRVLVTVEDTELFDFIEDHLTEDGELEYLWIRQTDEAGRCHEMTFPADVAAKVEAALAKLKPSEIEKIFALNNPTK